MAERATNRRAGEIGPSTAARPWSSRDRCSAALKRIQSQTPPFRRRARKKGLTPSPAFDKKTIALVYDFDGTLCPKPMQEYSFLPQLGIDAQAFWKECGAIARRENADPLITYMHLMYKKAKDKGLRIDRKDLVAQGAAVELYPGVKEWFGQIAEYVKIRSESSGVTLRHYLVSSGLTEIIEGTPIRRHFHNVFASEYWFDAYDLPFPKRVITDTGKTQYLFRINKGIEDQGKHQRPHARSRAADPVFQHDLLRRRRHRRAEHGPDAQKRRPRHRRAHARRARRRSATTSSAPAASTSTPPPITAAGARCSSGHACCWTGF